MTLYKKIHSKTSSRQERIQGTQAASPPLICKKIIEIFKTEKIFEIDLEFYPPPPPTPRIKGGALLVPKFSKYPLP
jgi:hypothetical protein